MERAASRILKVSTRTARRWCSDGNLRARKQGRAYIVDPVSVAELQVELTAGAGKKAPGVADTAPALPAPPSLPLQQASGQPAFAEASTFAEATADESADGPESGTKEEPAATGQALGQVKESLGPTGYQVRSLRSEVEHLAAVAEKLQEANKHLRTMKYIMALGAAASVILVLGLAGDHHLHDQHTLKQAQAAQVAVERRLTALEQAARPTVPVAAGIGPIQPTSKQVATIDSGTTVSAPPPALKPQEAKNKPKAKKPPPRATRTKRSKPKR
jgi:hypothetical protein